MMKFEFGLYSFIFSLMLGMAPAWADVVDISSMDKVEVGSWAELKAAVEDSANAGKAIVLTGDITADKDNPITSAGGAGIIIDGGGFTITGQEGTSNGQFINFSSDKTDLTIQNINLNGFGNIKTGSYYATGGAIYNLGTIDNINGDFSGNYAQSDSGFAYDGAIYNANSATIGNISGDFTGNYAQSTSSFAMGGAIVNYGTIGDISGDFSGNYAQSTSKAAAGGAIVNYGTIGDISGDFSGNYAKSDSGSAYGGAIYNEGTIGDITGDFIGNYAKSTSDAEGGAIFNAGTMTLINSSFYDNYVETGAEKESLVGQMTMGGAIFSVADLTIKADNGQSIFSGNKVKWADGEDSSAIMMTSISNPATLTLDSRNNGLIQFDDKIASMGYVESQLLQAQAQGATVTDDGQGGYYIKNFNGQDFHLIKTDGGFLMPSDQETGLSQDEVNSEIQNLEAQGFEVKQEGDNYIISGVDAHTGMQMIYEIIKQDDGTYNYTENEFYSEYGGNMVITGDSSSRVEFNNELKGFATYDISGTNVDVNEGAGTIYRTVTHDGGVLNINAGAKAEDSIINDKGTLNVANTAEIYRTEINSGGTLFCTRYHG